MSALAIGLAFTAGSLILFGFSWFLAIRMDRMTVRPPRPAPPATSGDDDQVARLERPWSV